MQRFLKAQVLRKNMNESLTMKFRNGKEEKRKKIPTVVIEGKQGGDEGVGGQVATVQKQKIKASELIVVRELRSEEDVDQYINTLSNKLKQIIKSNKEIEFIE